MRFKVKQIAKYDEADLPKLVRDYNLEVEYHTLTGEVISEYPGSDIDANEIIHDLFSMAEAYLPKNEGYYVETVEGEDIHDNSIYYVIYKIEYDLPPLEKATIDIELEGGLISLISGIPEGIVIHTIDHDCEKVGEDSEMIYRYDTIEKSDYITLSIRRDSVSGIIKMVVASPSMRKDY